MELTRRLAWGVRVWIDDDGVTRRGLLSRSALRWDEIDDYRIAARIPRASAINPLENLVHFTSAAAGEGRLAYELELRGGGRRLRIDSFFVGVPRVIAQVLARVGDRLLERARAELRDAGSARFGPLRLAPHAVQWADREPLPRQRVEALDLLDTSPARLRVMERGRVLPRWSAAMHEIPALHAALAIARELGFPVRDGELVSLVEARP